jgi:hypothetical protein
MVSPALAFSKQKSPQLSDVCAFGHERPLKASGFRLREWKSKKRMFYERLCTSSATLVFLSVCFVFYVQKFVFYAYQRLT